VENIENYTSTKRRNTNLDNSKNIY